MKNRNIISTIIVLTLGCFALLPVAQAVPPPKPEDRGNGNSAAENVSALNLGTTGSNNTAHGWFSLFSNSTGSYNTADGSQALYSNTTGSNNTGNGFGALFGNTTGSGNTATGNFALFANTVGGDNTAHGASALVNNIGGAENTAVGTQALGSNTTGNDNVAIGAGALASNTFGGFNTAVGAGALGTAFGAGNIGLGANAGSNIGSATNVIAIGHQGQGVSNTTWIENIYGVSVTGGDTLPVIVSQFGQLGTTSSSGRFKTEIKPIGATSEVILALKPVTFHYKANAKGRPQFGLIAEEVAKVNPDLVVRDANGEIYSVRYDAVNAMLLNEFLKEHKTVQEQGAMIARQQKQIEALSTGLQKVSAQMEMRKLPPQIVLNHP